MIGCNRAVTIATSAVAGQASDADRLELESHLEACARCRDEHATLSLVKRLRGWEPAPMADLARERARRAVIAAGAEAARRKPEPARSGRNAALALVGGLLAAGAVLAALAVRFTPTDRVLGGDVAVDGTRASRIGKRAALVSAVGGEVLLGGADVQLAAGSEAAWRADARTVDLARGAVTVDLPPNRSGGFRVATARFVVEVVGTRFTVDPEGVRVERGTVRVLGPDGAHLALVGAGQAWHLPVAAPPPPVAPPAIDNGNGSGSGSANAPAPSTSERPKPRDLSRAERLGQARRALSAGDGDRARWLLQPLLAPRAGDAEARAMLAESYLVEGRYDDAIATYRRVVHDFDGTPQAESALFAEAQLELESARPVEAARALTRYLARWPNGRFAREAREKLDRLERRSTP